MKWEIKDMNKSEKCFFCGKPVLISGNEFCSEECRREEFKIPFLPTTCPELKFNQDGTSNWDEVERFLYCNSIEYQKCSQLAHHLKLYDIDKFKIVIEFFYRTNEAMKKMLIDEISNRPRLVEKEPHK